MPHESFNSIYFENFHLFARYHVALAKYSGWPCLRWPVDGVRGWLMEFNNKRNRSVSAFALSQTNQYFCTKSHTNTSIPYPYPCWFTLKAHQLLCTNFLLPKYAISMLGWDWKERKRSTKIYTDTHPYTKFVLEKVCAIEPLPIIFSFNVLSIHVTFHGIKY